MNLDGMTSKVSKYYDKMGGAGRNKLNTQVSFLKALVEVQ